MLHLFALLLCSIPQTHFYFFWKHYSYALRPRPRPVWCRPPATSTTACTRPTLHIYTVSLRNTPYHCHYVCHLCQWLIRHGTVISRFCIPRGPQYNRKNTHSVLLRVLNEAIARRAVLHFHPHSLFFLRLCFLQIAKENRFSCAHIEDRRNGYTGKSSAARATHCWNNYKEEKLQHTSVLYEVEHKQRERERVKK